jgi:hypothetical protein
MVSHTPPFLESSPWKDNQDSVIYDDQAIETFEGGKGADDDNEWDDSQSASGSKATVFGDEPCSAKSISPAPSSAETASTSTPPNTKLPWSPDPRNKTVDAAAAIDGPPCPPNLPRESTKIDQVAKPLRGVDQVNQSLKVIQAQIAANQVQRTAETGRQETEAATPNHANLDPTKTITTPPQPPQDGYHTILPGISHQKRKAKASPKASTSLISKAETPRITKKVYEVFNMPATSQKEEKLIL